MPMGYETNRLELRVPRLSDAESVFSILGDAASRPYTFSLSNVKECQRYIAAFECSRRKHGFGPWVVIEKASGAIIGFGGLYEDPCNPDWGPEIGYHFARSVWGRGFATEIARLAVDVAQNEHAISRLRAFAHPDNKGSQAVLLKSGFRQERLIPEMDRLLFCLDML